MTAIDLSDLAARINARHAEVLRHARAAIAGAREVGALLAEAREAGRPADWQAWTRTDAIDPDGASAEGYLTASRTSPDELARRVAAALGISLNDFLGD